MKKSWISALLLGTLPVAAQAVTVAVIDSGYDYEHEALRGQVWVNPGEIAGDEIDNDGDGLIDDIYGWNFKDNTGLIIDYTLQESYVPEIEKFFELQLAAAQGKATEGEKIWLRDQVQDADFVQNLQTFANYAHGTHVAGIIAKDNPSTKLLAISMVSTKKAFKKLEKRVAQSLRDGQDITFIKEFILKLGLWAIAYQQSQGFNKIGAYLATHGVTVANGSLGYTMEQARALVAPLLLVLGGQPSQDLIDEFAAFFVNKIGEEQGKVMKKYPNILFVFAAGNEGADIDAEPVAPLSNHLDNALVVGASIDNVDLAPFSSYGATTVDVFAPGLGILSAVPRNDQYLSFSGASFAAAAATRVVAMIQERNPSLEPLAIREILKGTADRKEFLQGMAYSEGIINAERALVAAELSVQQPLKQAILAAQSRVADRAPGDVYRSDRADYSFITPM